MEFEHKTRQERVSTVRDITDEELTHSEISSGVSAISSDRKVSSIMIMKLLTGSTEVKEIRTYQEYESIYRIRHDLIHWIICHEMTVKFGEKPIGEIIPSINHPHWELVRKQTPDIFIVNGKNVRMIEITVSSSHFRERKKYAKYALLVKVLTHGGYEVDYKVMMFSVVMGTVQYNRMRADYLLSDISLNTIESVLNNFDNILKKIHSTDLGNRWFSQFHEILDESPSFEINQDMIEEYYNFIDNKPFNSLDDLRKVLSEDTNMNTDEFMDEIVDITFEQIGSLSSALYSKDDPVVAVNSLKKHHAHNSTTNNFRHYLPCPNIQSRFISERDTSRDNDLIERIHTKLITSGDSFLSEFGRNLEFDEKSEIMMCHRKKISRETRRMIAIEGPGRKKYIKLSQIHLEEQQKYTGYWMPIDEKHFSKIHDLSYNFSIIENKSSIRGIDDIPNIEGPGLNYVRFVQDLYREININALRKYRRNNHIIKPTNTPGIYVILASGPKLRTGLKPSTIWYRIILVKDEFKSETGGFHESFMSLKNAPKIKYSSWLSVDADRLDHYLRAFDKILMAYLSYLHGMCDTLINGINQDQSNTLGLIILIYMENKRSTSKMLQDVRYVVMNVLSVAKFWGKLTKKFTDPIRTPLHQYLLVKICNYIQDSKEIEQRVISSTRFGKPIINASISDIDDRYAGMTMTIDRILTTGGFITFEQILCEMYFCMLFNKNQDDATHSSFQILKKIMSGEEQLSEVKSTTRLHTGLGSNEFKDASELIFNPHLNQFCRRAIEVGSILQSRDSNNLMQNGNAHYHASRSTNMNKRLEDFATFKSSSITKNLHFSEEAYVRKYRTIENEPIHDVLQLEKMRQNDELVLSEQTVQNPRRRCLEGVMELIRGGNQCSYDLVTRDNLWEDCCFQIFKKNQIGGVREILILTIKKRIIINILETYSRNICRYDEREMMTSGRKKFSLMTNIMKKFKKTSNKSLNINHNCDKTKWGPTFMPIQFLYMFTPFKNINRSLFNLILMILLNHTNKKCLFPEELIKVWKKHPDKVHKNETKYLQPLKNQFLINGKQYITNESNMGQGILHYTSSYLHLCLLSFRNELYKKYCNKFKLKPNKIHDLVSSDDSLTVQNVPVKDKYRTILHIKLLLAAQTVAERLFNCRTSPSKSSISALIFEFNSMFGSNLTLFPTLFKFALSSVQPVNTDSFFRIVKESYNTSRQLVENGGSLNLYMVSQLLNKDFSERLYHTRPHEENAPERFGLRRKYVPYHIGVYPIMEPSMMIMLGPESWNYRIIDEYKALSVEEKRLFMKCHEMVDLKDPTVIAEMDSVDNIYVGMRRIEAKMGPVSKLVRIRRRYARNIEPTMQRILENPIMLFRKSKTIEESLDKVKLKLYQNSAAEALRSTAFSIYYGRYGASATARAYHIPFSEMDEAATYNECLNKLISGDSKSPTIDDIESYYPFMDEYRRIKLINFSLVEWSARKPFEVRTLRSLQLVKPSHIIVNPISKLLESFWIRGVTDETPNDIFRDWILLKDGFPILHDTLEETLSELVGDREKKIRQLILMILRMMGHLHKPMKMVGYGESSRSIEKTTQILSIDNKYPGLTVANKTLEFKNSVATMKNDYINMVFNIFMMNKLDPDSDLDLTNLIESVPERMIENFCYMNSISYASKKKIFIMLMEHGRISDISLWTQKTRTIFHQWKNRQIRNNYGGYTGKSRMILQQGHVLMDFYINNIGIISITVNDLTKEFIIVDMIKRALELNQLTMYDFESKIESGHLKQGKFLIVGRDLMTLSNDKGFHIELKRNLMGVSVSPGISYVENDPELLCIYDRKDNHLIMRTHPGLLPSYMDPGTLGSYLPDGIKFFGLSLNKMMKMGCFTDEFTISNLTSSLKIDLLDDLCVQQPGVSKITLERLDGIIDNEEKTVMPDMSMELETKLTETEIISFLIDDDDDNAAYDFVTREDITSPQYEWADLKVNSEILSNVQPIEIMFQSTKILKRIRGLKYYLIASMITPPGSISRTTIRMMDIFLAYKPNIRPHIKNSLVYVYDELYTTTTEPSPKGMSIDVDPEFNDKFSVV